MLPVGKILPLFFKVRIKHIQMAWSTLIILACVVAYVQAHGRLIEPVNRASLWRFGYNSPANYDDDGLNCGGFYKQWSVNGGKCGICGDAYDHPQPRAHELGGTYGLGYIIATYQPGQIVPITVYLSASHLGFWELRICPEPYYQEQECFDNGYLLELEEGGTKYYPTRGDGTYQMNFRLPADLTCEHCVLQWQYTAGNNWGVCANGTEGLGCGNQEQFYSCSDIAIVGSPDSNELVEETDRPVVTDAPPAISTPLIDNLTQDLLVLNPIEVQLLLRGIDPSQYRIFYGNTPVTSNVMPLRFSNKHKRKTHNKRKAKRHKKILYWR